MAKKIRIEETIKNKSKRAHILALTINVVIGICLIVIVCLYINLHLNTVSKKEYYSMIDEKNAEIDDLEIDSGNLSTILNGKSVDYIRKKLIFLDKNIVLKVKGYGNYYYSYDCALMKINGTTTVWIYTREAAISNGLKAGGC